MIKKEEVQYITKLARLGLKGAEIKKFQEELSLILNYFVFLREVDVSGIKPTFHPTEHFFAKKLEIIREDKARPQSTEVVNKLVEAVPEKKKGYIKVKAIF